MADFRQIVDFTRNYSDKHHHGKEEKFLFPEMTAHLGRVAETLVTNGMLVEHDLGRDHVMSLVTALDEYEKNPKTEYKLDIITEQWLCPPPETPRGEGKQCGVHVCRSASGTGDYGQCG